MNSLKITFGLLSFFVLFSCKKEENNPDENNTNPPVETVTVSQKTVSGNAKYYDPISGIQLWMDGDCELTARLEPGGADILGTGTISANGDFNITYKSTLPTSAFTSFQNMLWGSGITYTPSNGSMIQTVRHFVKKSDGTTKELFIKEFSGNNWVSGWSPIVMTQSGNISGTDLMGFVWSTYNFSSGWNFQRSVYDTPSVGNQTNECYSDPALNAVWYVGI